VTTSSSRASALALMAAATLGAAAPALADFTTPDAFGWARGAANSTHFQWEIFTSTAGPNAPDVASFPSPLPAGWAAPNVTDASVGSFVTGSGNIYNMGLPLQITATSPSYDLGPGLTTRIVMQVRTQGTEIAPASVTVNGVAPLQSQELSRQPLGGFGGSIVEVLYYFELPGNAPAYTAVFNAAEGSMSLDRLSIDAVALEAGCAPDWNNDTVVNSNDISAYLTAWLASVQGGTLAADFNNDMLVNSNDISSFLTGWLDAVQNGC
jgi:hypothetical protein